MRVIARLDTEHIRYGTLKKGQEYDIEEADFGDQIFEIKPDQRGGGKGKPARPEVEKEG